MFIDLTCPAELFRSALPTDDNPSCELLLYNLSDRIIVSVEVTLKLLNRREEEEEHLVYRARSLNGRPQTAFTMRVPCTPSPAIHHADITIEKVWFSDNAVWRRENGKEVSFTPNALPPSRGLTNLKYVAGESAVGYPSQQEGLWVCVCGRPNPDSDAYCARCRREKNLIFSRYNREAVEKQLNQKERQLELQSRSAREDTARMQRIREEAYQAAKLKKSRRTHLLIGMIAGAAVVALALGIGMPAARLSAARQMLSENKPEEASIILEDLRAFPGADSLLADARFMLAEQTVQAGSDIDALKDAASFLRSDNREGAKALAQDADFRRARLLLEAEDFAGSREAARDLPNNYPGLQDLRLETDYQEALSNMQARYYTLARNAFLSLGNYKDSASQADACIYVPALSLMENGEYDAARTQLSRIPDYEDSSELILKCSYLKGMALEKNGDLSGAAEAYFAAGNYEDAADKAKELTYILAEDAFTAASFEKAAAWYQRIPGYRDADEKALASLYTLARRAVSDLEYQRGLSLLSRLPADYEDTASLIRQATYALGLEAQEQEAWETAAEYFYSIPGYRDANRRLERVLTHLSPEEAAPFLPPEETEKPAETEAPIPTSLPDSSLESVQSATSESESASFSSYIPTSDPADTSLPSPTPTAEPTSSPSPTPTAEPTSSPSPTPALTEPPVTAAADSPADNGTQEAETPPVSSPEETDSYLVKDED